MRMFAIAIVLSILSCGQTQMMQTKKVVLTPVELGNLYAVFVKTQIKGSDADIVAPILSKLTAGYEKVEKDSLKNVTLQFNDDEINVCINVLNNITIEARWAEFLTTFKKKLASYLDKPKVESKK